MDKNIKWFDEFRNSQEYSQLSTRPIAYFCAEFALSADSPTYAGGLGVLAADMINEAADQNLPLVAIGMFYEDGYLHHEIQDGGTILKHPSKKTPLDYGFTQVKDANSHPLIISIPLQGRLLKVQAFEKQKKSIKIFLLDTDISENDPEDRNINNRLYVANKETRFKQQIVLGIAGMRLLEALKIHPYVYHLNEGHSALLSFEVAHHEMNEYKGAFLEELKRTKQHIVFTNHTLLAVGNDTFNSDLISALLTDYSAQLRLPVSDLIEYGIVKDSSIFSMTLLAMRMATHINAVSKLHAIKAAEIWPDHPMIAITNGIHVRTWDKIRPDDETISTADSVSRETNRQSGDGVGLELLWSRHQENKKDLLELIKEKTGKVWDQNHILFGWARRMVPYKRPLALFQNQEKLLKILEDRNRPTRIVLAGSAHENDKEGAAMLFEIKKLMDTKLGEYITYLPDYNINIAKTMTAGCDVWLNTPVVGFEACGTSGMKACLNGVLPCTTKDGWFNEIDLYGIGWSIDSDNITESLLETITHQIIPMYYFKDRQGFPVAWVENMHNSRELILNDYTATRMLKEYITGMYLPSIKMLEEVK